MIESHLVVSGIFAKTFNIYLGLLQLIQLPNCNTNVFDKTCSSSYPITTRLSDFSSWRGSLANNSAGLWMLVRN